jgi:hypothetical protein
MFDAGSIEQKAAIAACVVFPYLATYLLYRRGRLWPLGFRTYLLIVALFVVAFVLISFALDSTVQRYFSPGTVISSLWSAIYYQVTATLFIFPTFLLLIIPSILSLVCWRPDDLHYVCIAFSGFGHLFFLINVVLFMFDIFLIHI